MGQLHRIYSIATTIGTYFMPDYEKICFDEGRYELYRKGEVVLEINPMYIVSIEYEPSKTDPIPF